MFRPSKIIMALILGGFLLARGSLPRERTQPVVSAERKPSHTHIWERGTCRTLLNALAQPMGVGCQPGCYPILLLSSSTQMNVYQHTKDRRKAKELFGNLTDAKTHDDRLDEHDESKGHLIVRSIKEWNAAGFPGTWDDWWDR